jgi:hypothetical protein
MSTLLIFSCSSSSTNYNAVFEKKYSKEVKKINSQRVPISDEEKKIPVVLQPPTQEEVNQANIEGNSNYYPYAEVIRFDQTVLPIYFPGQEIYQDITLNNPANPLPENMFEISYYTALHPPFKKFGFEFDQIAIPPRDVYGINTELAEKPYLLSGNKALQKSIDQVIREKTAQDVENSEILIKEQKQLKRKQKMIRIFGDEEQLESSPLETKNQSDKVKIAAQSAMSAKKSQDLAQKGSGK